MFTRLLTFCVLAMCLTITGCQHGAQIPEIALRSPDSAQFTAESAESFNAMASGPLVPVYPGFAEQIVADFKLADYSGIGIDLGGGPGALVVELAKRTPKMFWIDADINTNNFPYLYARLAAEGMGARAGAIFADAHYLPFRDNYADIIVSRGTFQFWKDQELAFSEILRVLRPGGVAYIGRGLPDAMSPDTARNLREKHGAGPGYSVPDTAAGLETVMRALGVADYEIHVFRHPDAPEVNYGIWLRFTK